MRLRTHRLRRFIAVLVWLAMIVLIASGAAGLVTGMDRLPGSATRPEVAYAGDAEVAPMLDDAQVRLATIADEVEALSAQARGALSALNGSRLATVDAAIADGDRLSADITARAAAVRQELDRVPYVGTPRAGLMLSDVVVARHAALVEATATTDGLDADWRILTVGSISAAQMSALLAEHDRLVGEAAADGRKAKYREALKVLDQADERLAAARRLRDVLVRTVDVAVLDEWVGRNADYDVALRGLYKAISTARGRVTPAVREAYAAEAAAKARLPPDSRGLVIIMAEIGRGGMNGTVIAIEDARGRLRAALKDAAGSPTP